MYALVLSHNSKILVHHGHVTCSSGHMHMACHGVTRRKHHRPGIAPNANTTHVPTAGSSAAPTKPIASWCQGCAQALPAGMSVLCLCKGDPPNKKKYLRSDYHGYGRVRKDTDTDTCQGGVLSLCTIHRVSRANVQQFPPIGFRR